MQIGIQWVFLEIYSEVILWIFIVRAFTTKFRLFNVTSQKIPEIRQKMSNYSECSVFDNPDIFWRNAEIWDLFTSRIDP